MNKIPPLKLHYSDYILLVSAVSVIFLYVMIFIISPLNGEDFALTRDFQNYSFIDRISWVIDRSIEQSTSWNARLGEQLAIFWLSMPKIYFALFATFVFLAFNYFIANIVDDDRKVSKKIILSLIFIFALWPGMELFFWGTVNAGYMQPLVIILFVIYSYKNEAAIEKLKGSKYLFLIVSIASFMVGLSFENTPIAVGFFMFASLIFGGRKFLSWRTLTPIFTIGIGWLLLIFAPSTTFRRNFYNNMYGIDSYSAEYLLGRVQDVILIFLEHSWLLLLMTLFFSYWTYQNAQDKKRLLLLFSVILLVIISVVPAPYTEPRSFSLAWALMAALCISGVNALVIRFKKFNIIYSILFSFLLYFPLKSASMYSDFAMLMNTRDLYIRDMSNNSACLEGLEVKQITKLYPYKYLNNRDEWYRANPDFVSQYYECKVIIK